MLFLIRSAFWLTIVFASMSWPEESREPAAAKASPKAEALNKTLDDVKARVLAACIGAPLECWRIATGGGEVAEFDAKPGTTSQSGARRTETSQTIRP
jgi:hypothetical protein